VPEAVWQQPASATSASRLIPWLAWTTGVVCLLISLAIIERAPVPWLDEVYLVSVSNTVAQGPNRAERLVPRPEWVDGYEKIYGPVFFHTEAAFIRLFGLSTFSGRVAGWGGTVLMSLATIWLIGVVGGSVEFMAIAFAVMALTPELSVIARNGRMDSMALGFEFAGVASLLMALRASRRAFLWGLIAGVWWALAVLTTPRTLPFLAGLVVAAPVILVDREMRGTFVKALVCLYSVVLAAVYLWADHLEITVIGWFRWLWDCVKDDVYNVALPGHQRFWALGAMTAITPLVVAACIVAIALIAVWLRPRAGGPSRRRLRFWYLFLATTFNALFYLIVANYAFGVSQYFILPLLVVVLMATAVVVRAEPRVYRPMLAFWLVAALCFAGVRTLKYIEVWQTWELRDPKLMQDFVEKWVPRGSIVFGDDQYYFYAVENAGSVYRTFNLVNSGLEQLKSVRPRRQTVLPQVANSFLLWPVGDQNAPFPAWFDCAKANIVARYEAPADAIGIERIVPFAFLPYLHGYPTTMLYRVPAGCPLTGSP
jgi:hypothetical protein